MNATDVGIILALNILIENLLRKGLLESKALSDDLKKSIDELHRNPDQDSAQKVFVLDQILRLVTSDAMSSIHKTLNETSGNA